MTVFTIERAAVKQLASVSVCASTEEVAPTITGIHVKSDGKAMTATATDRYCMGAATVEVESADGGDVDCIVPAKEFAQAVKKIAGTRGGVPLRVTFNNDSWEVTDCETAMTGRYLAGTFPAVDRIVPKTVYDIHGSVSLNSQFVARMDGMARAAGMKGATWRMGGTRTEVSGKPGPIVAVCGALTFVLQPNLIPRDSSEDHYGRGDDATMVSATFGSMEVAHESAGAPTDEAVTLRGDLDAAKREIARLTKTAETAKARKTRNAADWMRLERDNKRLRKLVGRIRAAQVAERGKVPAPVVQIVRTGIDRAAIAKAVPTMTDRMLDRLAAAVSRGDDMDALLRYALGTTEGRRADALRAALAA